MVHKRWTSEAPNFPIAHKENKMEFWGSHLPEDELFWFEWPHISITTAFWENKSLHLYSHYPRASNNKTHHVARSGLTLQ